MTEYLYDEFGNRVTILGRPIEISPNAPACPVCGEYLIYGCDHAGAPVPEHLPRINGWGVDQNAPTLPPDPHPRPF